MVGSEKHLNKKQISPLVDEKLSNLLKEEDESEAQVAKLAAALVEHFEQQSDNNAKPPPKSTSKVSNLTSILRNAKNG